MTTIDPRIALTEGAEQRERRYGGIPARIVLQGIAAPSILGLFGFFAGTLVLAAHTAGWYGGPASPHFFFPFIALTGGLAQFLAGMWSYRARDGLATAVHTIWGAFFLAYGLLLAFEVAGAIAPPATGEPFPGFAIWFVALAAITWSAALAAVGESLGLVAVLSTLATGATILAVADWVGDDRWTEIGGWVLVVSAGVAWYVATAMMLESTFGRVVLPLGKYMRDANVPGGKVTEPVEYPHGMPGVRQGQ
jgi:succinate-acetate transporter protein